jgi:PAS domain S-box-containing protein
MSIGRRRRKRTRPWLVRPMPLLALLTCLFLCPCATADAATKTRLVVVLYPQNNDGSPGNALVDQSIRATFANGSTERIEVYDEYLDVSHPRDADDQQFQLEHLRRKYARRKVDLVIAGLSLSLDFALTHREQIFPGVPIVFCTVDEQEVKARKLPADVIGIPVKMDLAASLDLAIKFHPDTQRVFVIAGKGKMDAFWEAEARRVFRPYETSLQFNYLVGLPMEDLLTQVARLPERSIVYYLHVFQDGSGKVLVPAFVLEELASVANAPIYSHVDSYVGRGIVGGRVFSFAKEGQNSAKLALRILAGEKAETIGVQKPSANIYMFDWRQLQRWGISEDGLPAGSVVLHKEPAFWDLYKWQIIGVLALCVIQFLLLIGLLVQRASRTRAETRFRQVVEAAPNGILMVGPDGKIVLSNTQTEKLFGYRREELLGRSIEILVPERFRNQHPRQRDRFFAAPTSRPMGSGPDLFGQRKDGTEFPVEIGLIPVRTKTGLCALASVIDITERKRGDMLLRESEGRFRLMADTAPVMVWMSGPDKGCTYCNKHWLDFTGRSLEHEMGDGWSEGIHTDDVQDCLNAYVRAFDARQTFRAQYRLKRFDGAHRWILDTGAPRFNSDGTFEGYIGSCIDITDEKQAKDKLLENQRELQALTRKLLQAQEAERSRIARELHDDLNQSLALLSVEMDLLAQKPPESADQLRGRMNELSAQIKQLSSSVHGLSHQLHPSNLEQLGLVSAIRGLCKGLTQAHGLPIEVTHQEMPAAIADDVALCIYRIVQEALGNVVKHSGARHADVALIGSPNEIALRIVDDGTGFDPGLANGQEGLGLVSMRERLRLVAGEIAIDSRPSGGTRIDVRVPLPATGGLKTEPARIG